MTESVRTCGSTCELERAIGRNNFADDFFCGRSPPLLDHNFSSGVSGNFSGVDLAIETASAPSVSTDRPRFFDCVNDIVGSACGSSAIGLARNAEWGRRLAVAVLSYQLGWRFAERFAPARSENFHRCAVGTLMIWYLLRTKTSSD